MKTSSFLPGAVFMTGLSACIPASQEKESSAAAPAAPSPSGACDASGLNVHIGKILTTDLGGQLRQQAKAGTLRTAPHDGMITMDYSAQRLNIFYDRQRRIVRINCG